MSLGAQRVVGGGGGGGKRVALRTFGSKVRIESKFGRLWRATWPTQVALDSGHVDVSGKLITLMVAAGVARARASPSCVKLCAVHMRRDEHHHQNDHHLRLHLRGRGRGLRAHRVVVVVVVLCDSFAGCELRTAEFETQKTLRQTRGNEM